jgi:ubiquinone/menaquinone biosynthesis C-methylase UbiE
MSSTPGTPRNPTFEQCADFVRLAEQFGWDIRRQCAPHTGVWIANDLDRLATSFDYSRSSLANSAKRSWWFTVRSELIKSLVLRHAVGQTLWDIGGGVGTVSLALKEIGIDSVLVEPDPTGATYAARDGVSAIAGSLESLRLPSNSIDLYGCFDVLEHLEEPGELMAEFQRTLLPGGKLFITVPALRNLWSEADTAAGHFRRYRRDELDLDAERAGLKPIESGYWFKSLVVPMFVTRTIPHLVGRRQSVETRDKQLDRTMPTITRLLTKTERRLESVPGFVGTSVFGVYVKP